MRITRKLKQTRRLVQVLLFSGGLNILLLTLVIHNFFTERLTPPVLEQRPIYQNSHEVTQSIEWTNRDAIITFKSLSYEQLLSKLEDSRLVENGYSQRDLALSILTTFYHFDLNRAIKGFKDSLQKRLITYGTLRNGKPAQLVVYPSLNDRHFNAIIEFSRTEKWPQTSQGLYLILRKKGIEDTTLTDAFFLTPEFTAVETLFQRSSTQVQKNELLNVIKEGTWHLLSRFTEEQKSAQNLSADNRQHFLLEYIKLRSKASAYLLLKTDGVFAAKKLDDETVLTILNLIDKRTLEAEKFALDLVASPRSDAIWHMAANRLYEYVGEPKPEKSLHHRALIRFSSVHQPVLSPNLSIERTYVVQDGDNLWKIARRFQIDVDTIRLHNKIEGDSLHPGNILKIPSLHS